MIKKLLAIFRDSPNSFEGQEQGEKVVLLLRRHPFIILTRLSFFCLGLLLPIVVGFKFWSDLETLGWLNLFLLLTNLWWLGLWLAIFYSLTIYSLNVVIITDRRIIDSDQRGLFNRKVSELHSHRIQDVSTHTRGMIKTFLGFGDVTVQTAGSERQFVFCDIPEPEKVKDVIMQMNAFRQSGVKLS